MMVDDEALVTDIDKNIDKNQNMLKQTVARIDKVLTSASNNVLCYTLMFFIMILALLYKLTKWISIWTLTNTTSAHILLTLC